MTHVDMRKLASAAQEERRRQVIGLREHGLTYGAIAAQIGLSKTGVFNICQRFAAAGMAGLAAKPRGPEPGTGALLQAGQEAEVRALICQHMPDALGLPFALWSWAAGGAGPGRAALRRARLAVRTTGTHLARWGFTAQKPLRQAYEQRPAEAQRWLRQDYPTTIVARVRREKGTIFWGDETGLRSDDVRGRS